VSLCVFRAPLQPLWIEPYLYKRKTLYIIALISIFHNVSARVFSLYDPTIGFGLDIVTSDYWNCDRCFDNNILCSYAKKELPTEE
jgi:hypothetical protein